MSPPDQRVHIARGHLISQASRLPLTRVMVVTAPALITGLLRESMAGFEVVGEMDGREGLSVQVARLRPDLVVIGLERGEDPAAVVSILLAVRGVIALALSDDGPRALGYKLRIEATDLTGFSPAALADFVRSAAPRR